MKKLFIISVSLFVLTLLFLGVYNFAFKNNPKNPTVSEKRKEATQEATEEQFESGLAEEAIVETVSDTPVYGPAIIDANKIAFFRDGKLRTFSFGGGGEQIVIPDIPGKMLQVRWAPDRHAALALLESDRDQRWHLVDLDNRSTKPLKDGLTAPAWSNLSEKIFYFYRDNEGKLSINTAKPDGSDWKELAAAPALRNPFSQTVPESASFSFWSRPSAYEETELYTIPVTGGDPKRIFWGKYGASFFWSPDGEKILISNTIGRGESDIRLGLANQGGGEFHTLQVPTFISKTVWSKDSETVYYALPLSLPDNIALPDDYFSQSLRTSDSFWKLDTRSGKSERIVPPEEIPADLDSIDLFLDKEESYLFFTNRRDNRLYRIRLK